MRRALESALIVLSFVALAPISARVAHAADGTWQLLPDTNTTQTRPQVGLAATFASSRLNTFVFGGYTPGGTGSPGAPVAPAFSNLVQSLVPGSLGYAHAAYGDTAPSLAYSAIAFDARHGYAWVVDGARRRATCDTCAGLAATSGLWLVMSGDYDWWYDLGNWGRLGAPPDRYGHSLVWDEPGHRLWMYGGIDSTDTTRDDVWSLEVDSLLFMYNTTWRRQLASSPGPGARAMHGATVDTRRQRMFVGGGTRDGASLPTAIWWLDLPDSLGPRHWTELATTGSPTGVAISGIAYDGWRDRLLVGMEDGSLWELALRESPSTWRALDVGAPPAGLAPDAFRAATFDAVHDALVVPAAVPAAFHDDAPMIPTHAAVHFDSMNLPTLKPHLVAQSHWHGVTRQTWAMNANGPLEAMPMLLVPATGEAVPPVAVHGDSTLEYAFTGLLPDHWYTFRLQWYGPGGPQYGGDTLVASSPAPSAMSAVAETLVTDPDRVSFRWTLGSDSLSWLEQPFVTRVTADGPSSYLAFTWPDSSRQITWGGNGLDPGEDYSFALHWYWQNHLLTTGTVTLTTAGDPVPRSLGIDLVQHRAVARWYVPGSRPFPAVIEWRLNDGAWTDGGDVQPDLDRRIQVEHDGLVFGDRIALRLRWLAHGDTMRTAAVAIAVPPFPVQLTTILTQTRCISITGSLPTLDASMTLRLRRRLADAADTTWTAVGPAWPATSPSFACLDSALTPATAYRYQIVAADGRASAVSIDTLLRTQPTPRRALLVVSAGYLDVAWTRVVSVTSYTFYRRRNAGTFGFLSNLGVFYGDSLVRGHDGNWSPADSLTYRLNWMEADGRRRAAEDVVVHITPRTVTANAPLVGSRSARLEWNVPAYDTIMPAHAERLDPDGVTWREVGVIAPETPGGSVCPLAVSGLAPASNYAFRARWMNGAGELRGAQVTVHTSPEPSNVSVRAQPNAVTLVWHLTEAAPFTARLERSDGDDEFLLMRMLSATSESLVVRDGAVLPGATYRWRLAWDEFDGRHVLEPLEATIPVVTASLAEQAMTPGRVRLRWTIGGAPLDYPITVQRRAQGATAWDSLGPLPPTGTSERSFEDSTLGSGGRYAYRLVWATALGATPSDEVLATVPGRRLVVGRPSPNPAHAASSLAFSLPDTRVARVLLVDVTGRKRLEESFVGPGEFTWTLARGRVEPGVYFVRVEAGELRAVRRIVLAP